MSKAPRYYSFHTVLDGVTRPYKVLGDNIADAVETLRQGLYDGETIVGWDNVRA